MRRMPMSLGLQPQRRHPIRAAAIPFLLVAATALGAFGRPWVQQRAAALAGLAGLARARLLPAAGVVATPAVPPGPPPTPAPAPDPAAPALAPATSTPAAPAPRAELPARTGLRRVAVRIDGPLETSLTREVGRELGPPLAQVVTRALVWWVKVPGELRRGDRLEILFEPREGEEPRVHALRFHSGKLEQAFRAYLFRPEPEAHPRFFHPTGEELELRLERGPLDDYEQITSLLRDGRRHQGVDFRTPVGTPVKAPFSGVVTRKNWNWRSNGNCLELTESGGRRTALLLHLDELPRTLRVGQRVEEGQVVARSGNSGRSFAPHLHYQLMEGGERVLDPFESHPTYRRAIPSSQKAALDAEIARLDSLLDVVQPSG
jgi:murein DD-endopeptidase MepM/ murein hydrolase activator NlpD